ncbi:hypothetical protein Hdeb2414_s0005g00183361 [Helianthus debilis subsp. tardiflorus]
MLNFASRICPVWMLIIRMNTVAKTVCLVNRVSYDHTVNVSIMIVSLKERRLFFCQKRLKRQRRLIVRGRKPGRGSDSDGGEQWLF